MLILLSSKTIGFSMVSGQLISVTEFSPTSSVFFSELHVAKKDMAETKMIEHEEQL